MCRFVLFSLFALLSVSAFAQWQVQRAPAAGNGDDAVVIYSESASHNRLSLLKPAGSDALILLFSIPAASGLPLQLNRLVLQIDDQPMFMLGTKALAAWRQDPAHIAYPMTANGQTFSLKVGTAHAPARMRSLLRSLMDGQAVLVRYYRTDGRGMDIRFPLADFKPLLVNYFDIPAEIGDTERLAHQRCAKRFADNAPKRDRCLGKLAPWIPVD